eukprot:1213684-Prorocentrum_lima.AAC.1
MAHLARCPFHLGLLPTDRPSSAMPGLGFARPLARWSGRWRFRPTCSRVDLLDSRLHGAVLRLHSIKLVYNSAQLGFRGLTGPRLRF